MHTLTRIPRAWIDDAHDEWDHEARTYGPDDDDDDTAEIEMPVFLPEDDGEQDWLPGESGLWFEDTPDDTDEGDMPELDTFSRNAELMESYRQAAAAEQVHEDRLTANPDDAGALRDWQLSSAATDRIGEQLRAAGVWK